MLWLNGNPPCQHSEKDIEWTNLLLQRGAVKEKRVQQAALAAVVETSKHPHEIDGTQLQGASSAVAGNFADAVLVDLPHLLQVLRPPQPNPSRQG
jgi:hypothetical protein